MTSGVYRWMLLVVCALALPSVAWADWGALNMPVGVTEISGKVYDSHAQN